MPDKSNDAADLSAGATFLAIIAKHSEALFTALAALAGAHADKLHADLIAAGMAPELAKVQASSSGLEWLDLLLTNEEERIRAEVARLKGAT